MWLKRHMPYGLVFFFLFIYALCLFFFSFSNLDGIGDSIGALTGTSRVELSAGTFRKDATDLTVVLQSGETALLDEFTSLQTADFSGSSCISEIQSWADTHPQVSVRYTLTLPTGETVSNTATSLNLAGLKREDLPTVTSLLSYLPYVTSIDLGSSSQSSSPVTADDLAALQNACPAASISYTVTVLGQNYPLDTESIDLSTLTSAQVPETAQALSGLPKLSRIKLAENATTNGSLTWADLTTLAEAVPNAAIDYNFVICGVSATTADTSLDLSAMRSSDMESVMAVLPGMTQLSSINLGDDSNGLTWDDIDRIAAACPNASISYQSSVYGKSFNLTDTTLDLNHITVSDEGAAIKQIIPHMHNLTTLDMDSCGVSDSAMAEIRDLAPWCNVVWRVWFGSDYSVRTDVVKILASKPSKGGRLNNENTYALNYCTKVRYLDLGHNEDLSDFSFVHNMPDLEIVVISMAAISDLSPFSSCSNLIYMEAGNTNISDLSPLASCKNLRHLNIGTCFNVTDISPLYDLDLLRLWLGSGDPVPADQIAQMQSLHPDCTIDTASPTGLERDASGNITNEGYTSGWKTYYNYSTADWDYYAKYNVLPAQKPKGYFEVVYNAFEYGNQLSAYALSGNDPLLNPHGDDVSPVNMTIVDTSFLFQPYDPDDPANALPPT